MNDQHWTVMASFRAGHTLERYGVYTTERAACDAACWLQRLGYAEVVVEDAAGGRIEMTKKNGGA